MGSLIATADWHLGIRPYSLLRREIDFYKAAKKIIESLENDSIICNAGDIFDTTKPKFEAIKCLKEINDTLVLKNCTMFYIEGNHDKINLLDDSGLGHWTDIFNRKDGLGIYYLKSGETKIINNLEITGVGYKQKEDVIEVLKNLPYKSSNNKKLLMLHISCADFTKFYMENSFSINDIPNLNYWDYIIIGDTHVHKKVKINNTTILSPGPIEMISSAEDTKKFLYEIQDTDIIDIPVITRPCYKFIIKEKNITDDVIKQLREISKENPLVFIESDKTLIGLNSVYSIFDLDNAVIRFKFYKDNSMDIDSKINDFMKEDKILSLSDFTEFYLNKTNFKNNSIVEILKQLSRKEEVDIKEALDKLTNF